MALPTLLNDDERSALLHRLESLRPDAKPAWGSLDAPRMLCHIADQMRIALGEREARPIHTFVTRTLLKFLVIDTGFRAPRGKVQTVPEMLASRPASWESDLRDCGELVERVGRGEARSVHPAFGPLSPEEWGKLTYKHLDHHLLQFGV